MKAVYNFVVTPIKNRYNNTKDIDGKELIVNTEIFNHQYVSREAIVKAIPTVGETDIKVIRNFVDNEFLARDARDLRKYIRKIQPDVDLTFEIEDMRGNPMKIDIPVGIKFFWPDASI